MKVYILIFSFILPAVLSISSCTKVVDINLNDAAPKIIIEGSISDQASSCFVKLSKTVNFDEPNIFPAVTGSLVIITDDFGNKATLTEATTGIYTAPSYKGVAGRTYTISITAEGKTYTANSTMPDMVAIDTIIQDSFFMGNYGGGGIVKFVSIQYQDPEGKNNYYRFVEIINGTVSIAIRIDNDLLRDGNTITEEIVQIDPRLQTGDSVIIFLQTIDKGVFDYFAQLTQITGEGYGGQAASPANPTSNFNNGALGYFSAYAVRSKSIVIK
jgi:hypothetical protein